MWVEWQGGPLPSPAALRAVCSADPQGIGVFHPASPEGCSLHPETLNHCVRGRLWGPSPSVQASCPPHTPARSSQGDSRSTSTGLLLLAWAWLSRLDTFPVPVWLRPSRQGLGTPGPHCHPCCRSSLPGTCFWIRQEPDWGLGVTHSFCCRGDHGSSSSQTRKFFRAGSVARIFLYLETAEWPLKGRFPRWVGTTRPLKFHPLEESSLPTRSLYHSHFTDPDTCIQDSSPREETCSLATLQWHI